MLCLAGKMQRYVAFGIPARLNWTHATATLRQLLCSRAKVPLRYFCGTRDQPNHQSHRDELSE